MFRVKIILLNKNKWAPIGAHEVHAETVVNTAVPGILLNPNFLITQSLASGSRRAFFFAKRIIRLMTSTGSLQTRIVRALSITHSIRVDVIRANLRHFSYTNIMMMSGGSFLTRFFFVMPHSLYSSPPTKEAIGCMDLCRCLWIIAFVSILSNIFSYFRSISYLDYFSCLLVEPPRIELCISCL